MSRKLAVVLAVQLIALVAAVFGPLSAAVTGKTVTLTAVPADPIDPFRGAYVALRYPGMPESVDNGETVFVTLAPTSDANWRIAGQASQRPDKGTYLSCRSRYGSLSCGIESLFLPEAKAAAFDTRGTYRAEIKVDRWGHAHLVNIVAK